MQALTVATGMGLMGASGWLLSKAALHPSIAALQVAIVGVRAFGVARPVLRYLERLVFARLTLRLLTACALSLLRALVPLAPARLLGHRGGDLLARLLEDVGRAGGPLLRLIGPSLAAVAVAVCSCAWLRSFARSRRGRGACSCSPASSCPGSPCVLAKRPAGASGPARALAAGLVDGVRGLSDLLAFGRAVGHAAASPSSQRRGRRDQRRLARASAAGGALVLRSPRTSRACGAGARVPLVGGGRLDGVALASVAL